MPSLSGEELYGKIAEFAPGLARRIIFMTDDVISPSIQQFLQETKNSYSAKPFQLDQLLRLMEKAVATIEKVEDDFASPSSGN
jgi:DNA-binding NtrC family response regulator